MAQTTWLTLRIKETSSDISWCNDAIQTSPKVMHLLLQTFLKEMIYLYRTFSASDLFVLPHFNLKIFITLLILWCLRNELSNTEFEVERWKHYFHWIHSIKINGAFVDYMQNRSASHLFRKLLVAKQSKAINSSRCGWLKQKLLKV